MTFVHLFILTQHTQINELFHNVICIFCARQYFAGPNEILNHQFTKRVILCACHKMQLDAETGGVRPRP